MVKDNSKISKEIINFIVSRDRFPNLTDEQLKVLSTNLPKELMDATADSLMRNNRIMGTNKKIYKVNYNKSSTWVSFTGSQRKLEKVAFDLEIDTTGMASSEEILFKIIKEKGVNKYVGKMLEYMSVDDIWVLINKNISGVESIDIDSLQFEFEELTTDILTDTNKKTWFIHWEGNPLFQIQSGTNSRPTAPIFRINKKMISKFIASAKHNTETWGISVEVALCKMNSIVIPTEYEGRYSDDLVLEAENMLKDYINKGNHLPSMTECLATKTEGKKKSPTDFLAGELKVSVKTNYNGNTKVCPPDIGQPGISEGVKHYNRMMGTNFSVETLHTNNYLEFKKTFINNIHVIMQEQVRMLFSEDFILYLRKMKSSNSDIDFIDTRNKIYAFDKDQFTFSKDAESWNESISIRYKNIPVIEMQMHSGRSPFKFRINLPNLMKILKNEQGI